MKNKKELIFALKNEILLRAPKWDHTTYNSIYFGGGTPSLLSISEIQQLLNSLNQAYTISKDSEITFEVNPENLSPAYLHDLMELGINRLSMGLQSFDDQVLKWMNRTHDSNQARTSLEWSLQAGFDNITVDLIYGHPFLNMKNWEATVAEILISGVNHMSCYALTVERRTALAHWVRDKKVQMPSDEKVAAQYEKLLDMIAESGWEAYEISNFSKPGGYAIHNSNYWKRVPYLGLGPSAHSFDGQSRFWNVSHNSAYVKSIREGQLPIEHESLSAADQYNEYILTGLRTKWGCLRSTVKNQYSDYFKIFEKIAESKLREGWIINIGEDQLVLSRRGKLLADQIAADFFIVEENNGK